MITSEPSTSASSREPGPLARRSVAALLAGLFASLLLLPTALAAPARPSRPVRKATAPARKPASKPKAAPPRSATPPAPTPAPAPPKDVSIPFFRDGQVPKLTIEIPPDELQKLRQQNREYVRCTVIEDSKTTYEHVGIHLKGAAGSFRGVDDRPALTLNFDKFKDGQSFHDLDKIHLNNSVQDPGYLDELICSELFLAAGVPAARTTHARLILNGRDMGVYVLKEGFNKGFLKRHFPDPTGNLYEGGFVQDLDGTPKLQCGNGPVDRSDVKALVAACREGNPTRRWEQLAALVDLEKFFSFMALEMLTCHWDGYCQNRNNYRYYFEVRTGRVHFFPHGMDQMFRDPNAGATHVPGAMLVGAILSNPEWRARYRERLQELAGQFLQPTQLLARVDAHHRRLRPVFEQLGRGQANEFDQHTADLRNRLMARGRSLQQQLAVAEPRPPRFPASGVAVLTGWAPRAESADALHEKLPLPGGGEALAITAGRGGRCVASWRLRVVLPQGKYAFTARARTVGVKALEESQGAGGGLRISGSSRTNRLDGSRPWTTLRYELEVTEQSRELELVAELRAEAGQIQFDAASLRLEKLKQ